uniref:RING-type domain-containing protein n=1 Tax=Palpitomonas bilix TaxID=652834 RepID=A0A7S3GBT8_9EUKA
MTIQCSPTVMAESFGIILIEVIKTAGISKGEANLRLRYRASFGSATEALRKRCDFVYNTRDADAIFLYSTDPVEFMKRTLNHKKDETMQTCKVSSESIASAEADKLWNCIFPALSKIHTFFEKKISITDEFDKLEDSEIKDLGRWFMVAFYCLMFGDKLSDSDKGKENEGKSASQTFCNTMNSFSQNLPGMVTIEEKELLSFYNDIRECLDGFPTPHDLIAPSHAALACPDIVRFLTLLKQECAKFSVPSWGFPISLDEVKKIEEDEMDKAIGCTEPCPICSTMCSNSKSRHGNKHSCSHHKLPAFGGCHNVGTKDLIFDTCCSTQNFKKNWVKTEKREDGTEEIVDRRVFPEYVAKYYPNWEYKADGKTDIIPRSIKRAWVLVADRVAEHYGMNKCIPEGWEGVIEESKSDEICSACLENFTEEQQKKTCSDKQYYMCKTPCHHTFHLKCIEYEVNLKDKPDCPCCCRSLEGFNPWNQAL